MRRRAVPDRGRSAAREPLPLRHMPPGERRRGGHVRGVRRRCGGVAGRGAENLPVVGVRLPPLLRRLREPDRVRVRRAPGAADYRRGQHGRPVGRARHPPQFHLRETALGAARRAPAREAALVESAAGAGIGGACGARGRLARTFPLASMPPLCAPAPAASRSAKTCGRGRPRSREAGARLSGGAALCGDVRAGTPAVPGPAFGGGLRVNVGNARCNMAALFAARRGA